MNTVLPGVDVGMWIGGELDDDGTVAGPLQPLPKDVVRGEPTAQREPAPAAVRPPPQTPAPVKVAPPPPAAAPSARAERQLRACQAAAQSIVMGMFEHMRNEAQKRGNVVTIDDITEMREEFLRRTNALETALRRSFDDYLRERAREQRKDSREYPFDRIIVHQFAHLFVRRGDGRLAPGVVSRRVLPGFFIALEKMLGEAALEGYQEAGRRIIGRYAEQIDADGNWGTVYDDPLTRSLVLDALVTMGEYFADLEKRCAWLQGIINGHLAPGEAVLNEGDDATTWELSEELCLEMVEALFRPLAEALADPARRKALADRHGRANVKALSALAERITSAKSPDPAAREPAAARAKKARPRAKSGAGQASS
jgi:hypothetical protein